MTTSVGSGKGAPKLSKTWRKAGTTTLRMMAVTTMATSTMTSGYISAPRTCRRRAMAFSWCVARRASNSCTMPACSPAASRLQYSSSNSRGNWRNACCRLLPASMSWRKSRISSVMAGLAWPLPAMSKACSSGTPAAIMVDSWRVNRAISLCVMALPGPARAALTLLARMPWRRRAMPAAAASAARTMPSTVLPCRSVPFHANRRSAAMCASCRHGSRAR